MALLERTYRRGAVLRAKRTADELGRLADLLEARAVAFHALGRPIPESRDLEEVARLDPARGRKLGPERAAAAVAAGDTWKAIDARDDARAEFALAAALGGIRPDLAPAMPADVGAWVLGGPSLEARLLPLAAAYPAVLDDGPRALPWADLLLEEDPTSPDVLELVATIFGRDGRFGGTARML